MRAEVVTARCARSNQLFGMRLQDAGNGVWLYTWAFPIREEKADREGYSNRGIQGSLQMGDGWPGCPSCSNISFFKCGACEHLTCHPSYTGWSTCRWCSREAELAGAISELTARNDG